MFLYDHLYTMQENSHGRRSAQTAMFHIAEAMTRWTAPILSFTADEAWQYLPGERVGNVLFATWYERLAQMPANAALSANDFDELVDLRGQVNGRLELMRESGSIGSSLQAVVTLFVDKNYQAFSRVYEELKYFFINSELRLQPLADQSTDAESLTLRRFSGGASLTAGRTENPKCIRCWHYVADVGGNPEHPEICLRCVENVDGVGEVRRYF